MSDPQSLIQVQIAPPWDQHVDAARVERAIQTTLAHEGVPGDRALSFIVVDDAQMSRLHEEYRGVPGPTDVLTFPYEDEGVAEMAGYLGDVIVCYPQAARQAEEEGHDTQAEVELLAVHGTLHLLGYDDEAPAARAIMWERQCAVMEQLGLGAVAPRVEA